MKVPIHWPGVTNLSSCPDKGLQSIEDVGFPHPFQYIAWLIVFLSIEQASHVFTLFMHSKKARTFVLKVHPFEFPVGLGLLWVLFTASSHVLVALTYRSNAAVLTKGFHVTTEAIFLIQLASSFGLYGVSALSSVIVFIVMILVLSLPCHATIKLASYAGIVLDSTNFLAYLWFGFTKRDKILQMAIVAFGFHVAYLTSFIFVEGIPVMSDEVRGSLRLLGAVFNLIASEIFLRLAQRVIYGEYTYRVKVSEWMYQHDYACVWTSNGLFLRGVELSQQFDLFYPYTTAYAHYSTVMWNAFLPLWNMCIYESHDKEYWKLRFPIFVGYCYTANVKKAKAPSEAIVFSWNHIRLPYQILCFILSCVVVWAN